ncbi:hypothetical protein QWY77_06315 [Thalassotalea ponticola]|uniref:hypothetical protein n=1 Tax=Thalassotalea ponticola TaxID=1523392 RepID=UPI0025B37392|nr:hypothetical protein [Thalassotalea ponticola]MDN3652375.1 hypothetical protein [Thalassotalea ponticola]
MKTFFSVILLAVFSHTAHAFDTDSTEQDNEQSPIVKAFAKQHQELMPKVAVADMYAGCLHAKEQSWVDLKALIEDTDKAQLAEQLTDCLGEHSLASDQALNYGIFACFYDQMADLESSERQQNLKQVSAVLTSLPRAERQKSFTQCVNNQTLKYLQTTW